MDVKYNTDTKIEDNSRAFKLQKANFDKEVNTAVSNTFFVNGSFWVIPRERLISIVSPYLSQPFYQYLSMVYCRKPKHNLLTSFKQQKFSRE